jgi:asparagine synthase (glutamine-hydrolysing)
MLYRLRNGLKRRIDRARLPAIARQVMDDGLTYLSRERMLSLVAEVSRVNRLGIAGNLAEFGIALGGSSIVIAHKRRNRSFAGYDVFGMIPAPGSSDSEDAHSRYQTIKSGRSSGIAGKQYYGYQDDLYSTVVASFERHGLHVDQSAISLHKDCSRKPSTPSLPIVSRWCISTATGTIPSITACPMSRPS